MNFKAMSKASVLAATIALALSACTGNTRDDDVAAEPVRTERAPVAETPRRTEPAVRTTAPTRKVETSPSVAATPDLDTDGDLDGTTGSALTGVDSCDQYLTNYRACHAVIGAYGAEDIERRYQSLRSSLIERSLDPAQREALSQNCSSLAENMEEALDGRECDAAPIAPVADTDDPLLEDEVD